jgi:hypothetical protein
VVVQLETPEDAVVRAIEKLPFVAGVSREGNRLVIELTDPEKNRPELVKGIVEAGGRIMEVTETKHSLEDVYLSLVRDGGEASWPAAAC